MEQIEHLNLVVPDIKSDRCIIKKEAFNELLATLNQHCDAINHLLRTVDALSKAMAGESKLNSETHEVIKNDIISTKASVQALASAISIVQGE